VDDTKYGIMGVRITVVRLWTRFETSGDGLRAESEKREADVKESGGFTTSSTRGVS
jgi:hypothetical protein